MDEALKLLISVSAAGQVTVTGPVDNPILCYGILEEAKNVIRLHQEKKAASPLLLAKAPNGFRG
jgi:hypothetical protein